METQLRITIIVGCLITLIFVVNMIRKERLELKYSLSWIFIDIGVLTLSIFPKLIEKISKLLGVVTPINALFFLGICFQLIIIFSLTVAQSRNSKKLKDLVQNIAMLEYELKNK